MGYTEKFSFNGFARHYLLIIVCFLTTREKFFLFHWRIYAYKVIFFLLWKYYVYHFKVIMIVWCYVASLCETCLGIVLARVVVVFAISIVFQGLRPLLLPFAICVLEKTDWLLAILIFISFSGDVARGFFAMEESLIPWCERQCLHPSCSAVFVLIFLFVVKFLMFFDFFAFLILTWCCSLFLSQSLILYSVSLATFILYLFLNHYFFCSLPWAWL